MKRKQVVGGRTRKRQESEREKKRGGKKKRSESTEPEFVNVEGAQESIPLLLKRLKIRALDSE